MSSTLSKMTSSQLDLLRRAVMDGYERHGEDKGWSKTAARWGLDPGTLRGAAYATVDTDAQPTSFHDITFDFEVQTHEVIDVDTGVKQESELSVDMLAKENPEPNAEQATESMYTTCQHLLPTTTEHDLCRFSSVYVLLQKVALKTKAHSMTEMVKDREWLQQHLRLSRRHRRLQRRKRASKACQPTTATSAL